MKIEGDSVDKELIWSLVRLLVVLAVVIPGAIYTTRWYGKRLTPSKNLKVKEALSLGPNKALYLIEWEKRDILVGVTNQSITLLNSRDLNQDTEEVGET